MSQNSLARTVGLLYAINIVIGITALMWARRGYAAADLMTLAGALEYALVVVLLGCLFEPAGRALSWTVAAIGLIACALSAAAGPLHLFDVPFNVIAVFGPYCVRPRHPGRPLRDDAELDRPVAGGGRAQLADLRLAGARASPRALEHCRRRNSRTALHALAFVCRSSRRGPAAVERISTSLITRAAHRPRDLVSPLATPPTLSAWARCRFSWNSCNRPHRRSDRSSAWSHHIAAIPAADCAGHR